MVERQKKSLGKAGGGYSKTFYIPANILKDMELDKEESDVWMEYDYKTKKLTIYKIED